MKTSFVSFAKVMLVAASVATVSASTSFAQQIPEPAGWHFYADCHSDSYFGGWDIKIYLENGTGKVRASLERHAGPDGDGSVIPFTVADGVNLDIDTQPRSVQFMINSKPKRYLSISHYFVMDGFHRGVIDTVFPDGSKDAEQLLCTIR